MDRIPEEIKLTGDASKRTFYRAANPDGSSSIRMITPSDQSADYTKFLKTQSFLAEASIPVPEIKRSNDDLLEIVLQDLGDKDYFTLHPSIPYIEREQWYGRFLDLIVNVVSLTDAFVESYEGEIERLDADRLFWELRFFLDHFERMFPGSALHQGDRGNLLQWMQKTSSIVASFEVVLCHRDFHSKNIMIHRGNPYLIDFQDMRLGPYNYDLVSLLWDSYLDIEESIIEAMGRRYYKALDCIKDISWAEYQRQNRLTAVQRNLKAIGTFMSQANMGKRMYLRFIPPTKDKLSSHFAFLGIEKDIRSIIDGMLSKFG